MKKYYMFLLCSFILTGCASYKRNNVLDIVDFKQLYQSRVKESVSLDLRYRYGASSSGEALLHFEDQFGESFSEALVGSGYFSSVNRTKPKLNSGYHVSVDISDRENLLENMSGFNAASAFGSMFSLFLIPMKRSYVVNFVVSISKDGKLISKKELSDTYEQYLSSMPYVYLMGSSKANIGREYGAVIGTNLLKHINDSKIKR